MAAADPNGNHDSGYAPSNIELAGSNTPPGSPRHVGCVTSTLKSSLSKRNGVDGSPKKDPSGYVYDTFIHYKVFAHTHSIYRFSECILLFTCRTV